ncbi:MAG TPA: hypothetical protein VD905_07755, partial [Flavobacteriales bacterium]|nr:hypothetical protein [Flavobacteriales bacterium]
MSSCGSNSGTGNKKQGIKQVEEQMLQCQAFSTESFSETSEKKRLLLVARMLGERYRCDSLILNYFNFFSGRLKTDTVLAGTIAHRLDCLDYDNVSQKANVLKRAF